MVKVKCSICKEAIFRYPCQLRKHKDFYCKGCEKAGQKISFSQGKTKAALKKLSNSVKISWKNPSVQRLKGLEKMAKTRKRLYREGKINHWSLGNNAAEVRKKIGRSGSANGMYGKTPWNKGKKWGKDVRRKLSLKAKLRVGKLNSNWKEGISSLPYGPEFTGSLRQVIRNKFGRCLNCELTNEEHILKYGAQLAIHHIDYDKKNNSLSNLMPLCFRCNSLANGSRIMWTVFYQKKMSEIQLDTINVVSTT